MDLVVKISDDYVNHEAQLINPSNIVSLDDILNIGTLNFSLDIFDPQISSVIRYKKVELFSIKDGQDTSLWTGYINDVDNDSNFANLICTDEKSYQKNKMILVAKNWVNVPIADVLDELVTEANARRGPNEAALSYSTSLTALVTKDFEAGTSYFDIINEIVELLKVEWKVEKNVVIVETTIGTDRTTSGDDFISFIWNKDGSSENNITSFLNSRKGAEIATVVLGKDNTGTSLQTGDTSVYGAIERPISFNDGDLVTQTQEYLAKKEQSQIERGFDVRVSEEEFEKLRVGDMVKVLVVHGSILADVSTSLKVISKHATFSNKKPTLAITLATESKGILNMKSFLADLLKRTKRLELN